MLKRLSAAAWLLVLAVGGPAAGQAPPRPLPSGAVEQGTLSAAWEWRRDRHTYRFENPSRLDGSELVPHYYEQDYDQDNQWLTLSGRYRGWGRWWRTEAGVAWWGTGLGSDYDTFFLPEGDVVVYGTTASTALASFSLRQVAEIGSPVGFGARVSYAYRRDRADFAPSDSITRHSRPPSETRRFNTDRETTVSEVHEVQFGLARRWSTPGRWTVEVTLDATPVTVARLTTKLPDKYPDDIVAIAKGFSLAPAVAVDRAIGPLVIGGRVSYARTWPYGTASLFTRHWFGAGFVIGWRGRHAPVGRAADRTVH